jgi:hypothetical protein
MAVTPLRNFRCDDKTWSALYRIAEERGQELSLPPSKLMSSLCRQAIEQFIERHKAAKRAEKQTADVDLDRSDRKPVIASKRDRKR